MSESKIKRDICDWLNANGFYTVLNVVTNQNGLADVTVYCPGGRVFLIETKQPGKNYSKLQQYRQEELFKKVQVKTFRADSLKTVKKIVTDGEFLSDKG